MKTLFLLLFLTTISFSQTKDYFISGFNAGYTNTCKKYGDGNCKSGNSRECNTRPRDLTHEKNANQKLYQDGYECGIMQAMDYINSLKTSSSNTVDTNEIKKASELAMQKEFDRVNKENEAKTRNIEYKNTLYNASTINKIMQEQRTSQTRRENAVRRSAERFENGLANLNAMMQQQARANLQKELDRRTRVANNFIRSNDQKLSKIKELYSRIPKSKFGKVLNGVYRGYVVETKKYTLLHNQESSNVIDCYVSVVDDIVTDVYLFGKKEIFIDAPKKQPENSKLSNGIVKYTDFSTLSETTVVLLEPYLSDGDISVAPSIGKDVSYVSFYSPKKDYEGRTLFIQELDKSGNVLREFTTKVIYAKKVKDVSKDSALAFNAGNTVNVFSDTTLSRFGDMQAFAVTPNIVKKPMNKDEHRAIKIMRIIEN